jgi:1-deoxy-D-xylulose-5-phosphate reductoisomerase
MLSEQDGWLSNLEIVHGEQGLKDVAAHPDANTVLCAISGSAGLGPTLEALRHGKQIALATKEALVMAGQIIMQEARRQKIEILPVDSEHNAIHQCLRGERPSAIRRIILTASGGPFRNTPIEVFNDITPELALQHPVWQMGRKITIDSATMMNKGLEIIEAHWLFGVSPDTIEVLIHPQSTIHSLVEMIDGSVMAQLGIADMRMAIQYVLTYPTRRSSSLPSLDLKGLGRLEFESVDHQKFPCVRLAYNALRAGGTMPAVMNAANEIAVEAFLDGHIRFNGIAELTKRTMDAHSPVSLDSVETVLEADQQAREKARELITASVLH